MKLIHSATTVRVPVTYSSRTVTQEMSAFSPLEESIPVDFVVVFFFAHEPLCNCCMKAGQSSVKELLLAPTEWSMLKMSRSESSEKHWKKCLNFLIVFIATP